MSYFKLYKELINVLDADPRIKTILDESVEDRNIDIQDRNIYALAYISISDSLTSDNLNTYSVSIQCVDAVVENNNHIDNKFVGNDNRQEVYNDMDNVITRMYKVLKRDAEGTKINIISISPSRKIYDNENDNRLAGWEAIFQVEVPNEIMNVCDPI